MIASIHKNTQRFSNKSLYIPWSSNKVSRWYDALNAQTSDFWISLRRLLFRNTGNKTRPKRAHRGFWPGSKTKYLMYLPSPDKPTKLAGVWVDPVTHVIRSGRWTEFTRRGVDNVVCITTLCSPLLLVVGTEEVFPADAGPVLAASRCGRLGVATSHCGSSTSPRPTPMSIEMGEFPCKGLVNAWSCLNGDCKKKFRSR